MMALFSELRLLYLLLVLVICLKSATTQRLRLKCPRHQYYCIGTCVSSKEECGLCPFPLYNCRGTCVAMKSMCRPWIVSTKRPSTTRRTCSHYEYLCPDGYCRRNCCSGRQKECRRKGSSHFTCVSDDTYTCSYESCSKLNMEDCGDSSQCYRKSEKCDRVENCRNGADESGCYIGLAWWLIVIIVATVMLFLTSLCYFFYRAIANKKSASESEVTFQLAPGGTAANLYRTAEERTPINEEEARARQELLSPRATAPPADLGALDPTAPPPTYEEAVDNPGYKPSDRRLPSYDAASKEPLPSQNTTGTYQVWTVSDIGAFMLLIARIEKLSSCLLCDPAGEKYTDEISQPHNK